jgi:hypothetical protein
MAANPKLWTDAKRASLRETLEEAGQLLERFLNEKGRE